LGLLPFSYSKPYTNPLTLVWYNLLTRPQKRMAVRERDFQYCTPEALPESWEITRVEIRRGHKTYIPTKIRRDGSGPYSHFVLEEIRWLHTRIEALRGGSTELNQAETMSNEERRRSYINVINTFCGHENATIEFIPIKGGSFNYRLALKNGNGNNGH